jgi:isocitrate dehydrogenase
MSENTSITVAYGDGIGPEIMEATLSIIKESGAKINIETAEVGKRQYEMGYSTGITPATWESIKRTKILLKSPITTPQGGGYKSLNVTMRKTLGLYANVRPCISYPEFIKTNHPLLNTVIVRENEEDLYSGIEYRQTHNMYETLKLITRVGSERIVRYAFEYAMNNNRKKVTCFSKDNIMKMSDGIFHRVFDEIAKQYPSIQNEHYIVDIGSARLANKPEIFDVIVTSNLYGDIISDIAAEISGSVGLAGSANIGAEYAMFEAIHGSAPDIAGKNMANPSGLLHAAIMMLVHIGQGTIAAKIHNAWLRTLEDGMHTVDIYNASISKEKLGTKEFAMEVIKRLGQSPTKMPAVSYKEAKAASNADTAWANLNKSEVKQLVGVDVYFDWYQGDAGLLADQLKAVCDGELQLQMVSCRGLKVWPFDEHSFNKGSGDHWRTRFVPSNNDKKTTHTAIVDLLSKLALAKFDVIKTENLYSFDDKIGFSLDQGE